MSYDTRNEKRQNYTFFLYIVEFRMHSLAANNRKAFCNECGKINCSLVLGF